MADPQIRSVFIEPACGEQALHLFARKIDPVISPRTVGIRVVFVCLPRIEQKSVPFLKDDLLPLSVRLIGERPLSAHDKMQRKIYPCTALPLFIGAAPLFATAQKRQTMPLILEQCFAVDIYFKIAHRSPFR